MTATSVYAEAQAASRHRPSSAKAASRTRRQIVSKVDCRDCWRRPHLLFFCVTRLIRVRSDGLRFASAPVSRSGERFRFRSGAALSA